MALSLEPVSIRQANDYVRLHHRHSTPVQGAKFALAATNGELQGVAIVGRPVNRHLDDGRTLEVLRVCTLGGRNACSFLYGASWRAARALGYGRVVTYNLADEPGASLRAAGYACVAELPPREHWHPSLLPAELGPARRRWERPPPSEDDLATGARRKW